jgi:hypothetical protein
MLIARSFLYLAIFTGLTASGCATHTGTGALAGGGLGAVTGALIGGATGDAGAGAAVGAGLGAVAGGLVGAGQDEVDRKNQVRLAAATAAAAPGPVSMEDVIQMTRSGVHEDTIIATLRANNAYFQLTPQDVGYLTQQGVGQRVITAMQQCRRPVVVRHAPIVYERPVYFYDPCPPPISIGFGYHHHRCRPRHCW